MNLPFTVNYDVSDGFDYDESFSTLREAVARFNRITVGTCVTYKNLTYDSEKHGTLTLLDSKGADNLRKFGFLPCDYN